MSMPEATSAPDAPVINMGTAIRDGLLEAARRDPSVIFFGEGVEDPAALFGTLKDIGKHIGHDRMIEMPIAENGLIGGRELEAFLTRGACGGEPRAVGQIASAGSGQPMCCRQTAQRGSGFLHLGFGHTLALGVGRRSVDSAARPGSGWPAPAFMRGAPLPVTSDELQ